jgi:hypothetical protein
MLPVAFVATCGVFFVLLALYFQQCLAGDDVAALRHDLIEHRIRSAARQQRRQRPLLPGRGRLSAEQALDRARLVIARGRLAA